MTCASGKASLIRRSMSDPAIAMAFAPDVTIASMQGPNQLGDLRRNVRDMAHLSMPRRRRTNPGRLSEANTAPFDVRFPTRWTHGVSDLTSLAAFGPKYAAARCGGLLNPAFLAQRVRPGSCFTGWARRTSLRSAGNASSPNRSICRYSRHKRDCFRRRGAASPQRLWCRAVARSVASGDPAEDGFP